jgi:two-component system sensor histidine kinase KdpD
MVENLLDMARLRSGRVAPRKAWQPVEEVIGSSVRAIEAVFPDRSIAIDLQRDLPLMEWDGVLVERALVNLLDNAVKHGAGSPIGIRAGRRDARLEISVEDAGPGLPDGDPARLFDMFERGDAEGRSVGTGMGLAIARTIVEAHGGSVAAANREGGGARFTVAFPIAPPPAELQAAMSGEGGRT